MSINPASPTTVFGPLKKKLGAANTRLASINKDLSEFNPQAYNSMKDFVFNFNTLKEDIQVEITNLWNNLDISTGLLQTAIAAKSSGGVAIAVKKIKWLMKEIIDGVQCIILIGKIVTAISNSIRLIVVKIAELTKLLVRLAMEAVAKYLAQIKSNVLSKVNEVKAAIVSNVCKKISDSKMVAVKMITLKTNELIVARKKELASFGKDALTIEQDPQIKAWEDTIATNQGWLRELADHSLDTNFEVG